MADPKKVAQLLKTSPEFRKELADRLRKANEEYKAELAGLRKAGPPAADRVNLASDDTEYEGDSRSTMDGYPGAHNHYIAVAHPITDHPSFVGSTQDASKWRDGRVTSFHDYYTLAQRATRGEHKIFAIKWHNPDDVHSIHSGNAVEAEEGWYDDRDPNAWSGSGKFTVLHEVKGGPTAGVDELTPKAKRFRIPSEARDPEATPKGGGVGKSQKDRNNLRKAALPIANAGSASAATRDALSQVPSRSPFGGKPVMPAGEAMAQAAQKAPVGVHPMEAGMAPTTNHTAAHAAAKQAASSAPSNAPSPLVTSDTTGDASQSQANQDGGVDWVKVREAAGIARQAMRNPIGTLQEGLDRGAQEAQAAQKAEMPSNKMPKPAKPKVPMAAHPAGGTKGPAQPPTGHGVAPTPTAKKEIPVEKSAMPPNKKPLDKATGPWGPQTRANAADAQAFEVKRGGIAGASTPKISALGGSKPVAGLGYREIANTPGGSGLELATPDKNKNKFSYGYAGKSEKSANKKELGGIMKGELCASCGKAEHLGKCSKTEKKAKEPTEGTPNEGPSSHNWRTEDDSDPLSNTFEQTGDPADDELH